MIFIFIHTFCVIVHVENIHTSRNVCWKWNVSPCEDVWVAESVVSIRTVWVLNNWKSWGTGFTLLNSHMCTHTHVDAHSVSPHFGKSASITVPRSLILYALPYQKRFDCNAYMTELFNTQKKPLQYVFPKIYSDLMLVDLILCKESLHTFIENTVSV